MTDAEFADGVRRWHESDSTLDIWEFLGMSREEYAERVTGTNRDHCYRCGTVWVPGHGCFCSVTGVERAEWETKRLEMKAQCSPHSPNPT